MGNPKYQPQPCRMEIDSPTVTHEPGLSTAHENGELFSGESLMSLALTTTHENTAIFRGVSVHFLNAKPFIVQIPLPRAMSLHVQASLHGERQALRLRKEMPWTGHSRSSTGYMPPRPAVGYTTYGPSCMRT